MPVAREPPGAHNNLTHDGLDLTQSFVNLEALIASLAPEEGVELVLLAELIERRHPEGVNRDDEVARRKRGLIRKVHLNFPPASTRNEIVTDPRRESTRLFNKGI